MNTTPPGPGDKGPGTNDPWPLPPRLELFSDPQARVVWPAIIALAEAAQHDVLRHLQVRLAIPQHRDSTHRVRQARAVAALREAHDLLHAERTAAATEAGGQPEPIGELALTADDYTRLRALHPELGWPPRSTVVGWLGGSWASALRSAHLPAAPGGDTLKVANGERFCADELRAALRECASDTARVPSIMEYRRWAISSEVLARPGRRPRTNMAFARKWGSWTGALAACGLLDAETAPPEIIGGLRTGSHRYSDEQLRDALREVAERLGRSPRPHEYSEMRQQLLGEEQAAGHVIHPRPNNNVFYRRFDSWDAALAFAELEPLRERDIPTAKPQRQRGPLFSEEQMWEALERCLLAYDGEYIPARVYTAWARQQVPKAPSFNYIHDRLSEQYDGWPGVICEVQRRLVARGAIEPPRTTAPWRGPQFTEAEMFETLMRCIAEHDGHHVSLAAYGDWTRRQTIPAVSSTVLRRTLGARYSGWSQLVAEAQRRLAARGLQVTEVSGWWVPFTDEEMWAALRRALAEHDGNLSTEAYRAWVKRQQRAPSLTIVYRRLTKAHDGWAGVIAEAKRRDVGQAGPEEPEAAA